MPQAAGQTAVSRRNPVEPGDKGGRVKSAVRAMEALEFFHDMRRPARVIEVAGALGLPSSSTCELLKTLVDTGHLSFDSSNKTYFPSYRLAKMTNWLNEVYDNARLRDMVDLLSRESGEAAALMAEDGLSMQVVMMTCGEEGSPNQLTEGCHIPIIDSISGAALLMAKTPRESRQIISRSVSSSGTDSRANRVSSIMSTVSQYRRVGYAFTNETIFYNIRSLAIPLRSRTAPTHLVLGCGGPPERMGRRALHIGHVMREAVNRYFDH
jgi:DNA-binding IclR family transcriptional regulator